MTITKSIAIQLIAEAFILLEKEEVRVDEVDISKNLFVLLKQSGGGFGQVDLIDSLNGITLWGAKVKIFNGQDSFCVRALSPYRNKAYRIVGSKLIEKFTRFQILKLGL